MPASEVERVSSDVAELMRLSWVYAVNFAQSVSAQTDLASTAAVLCRYTMCLAGGSLFSDGEARLQFSFISE